MSQPSFISLQASAKRAGYTRRVIVELDDSDLYGWIRPNADLDGAFSLIDDESGVVFNLQGHAVNVRDLDD